MQIREPELEVCLVVLPRQPVYTGRGVPFQLKEREPKEINADMVEERGEPFFFLSPERPAMALFHHDNASGSFASRVLPGWRVGLRLWRHKRRWPLRGIGPIVGVAVDNLGLVGDLDAVFINPKGRRP
jgi:hypothetical protein